MTTVAMTAVSRSDFGKGAARKIRRENKVPVVLYGHGTEPQHLSLPGHDLLLAVDRHREWSVGGEHPWDDDQAGAARRDAEERGVGRERRRRRHGRCGAVGDGGRWSVESLTQRIGRTSGRSLCFTIQRT